jgi:lysophospholipase L1-like esterase
MMRRAPLSGTLFAVRTYFLLLLTLASFGCVFSAPQANAQPPAKSQPANQIWISTWGTSQQIPEPQNALPPNDLRDATVRQIVHLSVGGAQLRVHLSNAFGTDALHVTSAHIARPFSPASPAIDPATDKPLTFGGSTSVTIPTGAEILSDPIEFPAAPLSNLAVTFHLDTPPAQQTGHPGSRATTWYVHGNTVAAPNFIDPKHVDHSYQLSAVDVLAAPGAGTIIALGDSITDGHGATTNGNDRWTDVLAARLQAAPARSNIAVSNQGIGGNHLLVDGLGPNALARFDRDVLAPAGVRWLIVLEGVNDLGGLAIHGEVPLAQHAALVEQILAAYQQMVLRAHTQALRVIGATIIPYVGSGYYHPGPLSEADRQAVNQWIRTLGHFDAVLDFDKVTADPRHPDQLLPAYDSGDHLHPSPAGYRAMADSIPLSVFTQ